MSELRIETKIQKAGTKVFILNDWDVGTGGRIRVGRRKP